ncbi:MAG: NUDIX hydrolase [Aggregatilineales bacterium]
MADLTLAHVRAALALAAFEARAAQGRMAPSDRPFTVAPNIVPRQSAVMLLLYPLMADSNELAFALMRRAEHPGGVHSGQISLPGGSCEPGESWEQAARRELCEELGVCDQGHLDLVGVLTPLYVPPSNFEIHPVVGALPERPTFQLDPREVAGVLEVPLRDLFDDTLKRHDEHNLAPGRRAKIHYYWLRESVVWGATAIILSEFEHRLRTVLSDPAP